MPAGAATPPASASHTYAFSFADADIASVANEILGETLHIPYTLDPAVTGKVTLRIEKRLTAEQLLAVFEAALVPSGVAMVRAPDGAVTLVPKAKARASGSVRTGGRERAGYQTVAEPLRYATPSEVAKVLSAMGSGEIVVHADDRLGLLVLGGTLSEIKTARQTIAVFDRSGLSDARQRMIPLRAASADAVAEDLDRLVKAAELGGVAVVPMRQLNALVLMARSPAVLLQLEGWVQQLDRPSAEEATSLWIYRPHNVSAEALADALRALSTTGAVSRVGAIGLAPGGAPGPGPPSERPLAPTGTGGPVDPDGLRVSVEKSSNSLLIMAPGSRWRALQPALVQLDRAPEQVLIEATVLEVTLNHDFRFGVDWSLVSANGKVSVTLSQFETGAVTPAYPGVSLTYLNGGVRAVVDALAARTNVEVMSSPKLVALDNQTAALQVGDQVPVVVQRAQGTGAADAPLVVTTEYRDTGVIMKIKPRINGEHSVLLELTQEVSGVAKTTTSGIDSPTIQQRKFESSLQIQEGQTLALGGLISSAKTIDDVGIPLLKDIPVAGALFRTSTKGTRRTELIVLLSARILHAGETASTATDQLKRAMPEIERRGLFQPH